MTSFLKHAYFVSSPLVGRKAVGSGSRDWETIYTRDDANTVQELKFETLNTPLSAIDTRLPCYGPTTSCGSSPALHILSIHL